MWQVQTDGSHLLPAATKLATPAGLAMGCMSLESPLIIPFKIAAYDLSTAAQNVVAELLQVCVAATAGGSCVCVLVRGCSVSRLTVRRWLFHVLVLAVVRLVVVCDCAVFFECICM